MTQASEKEIASKATESAQALARLLEKNNVRVVFAESCTAGLVAALLGQVPGISNWLCGSAVTYRESVKQGWLGVSAETLSRHTAESLETTSEMAMGVLRETEEATFSAAVTGHLGPGAPLEMDGKIFISIAHRTGNELSIVSTLKVQLTEMGRIERQFESAKSVLDVVIQQLID